MKKNPRHETNKGRRDALKTIVMGAGGLTTLPILGQVEAIAAAKPATGVPAGVDPQSAANWKPQFFDAHQNETLITLTELIIPATDTPGAKAALVNRYIDLKYHDLRAGLRQNAIRKEEIVQGLAGAFSSLQAGILNFDIPSQALAPLLTALGNLYIELKEEETNDRPEQIIQALAWFDGRSLSLHNKSFVSLTEAQQTALLEPLADPANSKPEDQPGVKAFNLIKDLTIFGYYTSRIGLDEELKYEGDRYNTSFPGACTSADQPS